MDAPQLNSSLRAKLVGRWTLVSLEIVGDQDVEYPMGRDVSGDPSTATLSELSVAVNGYVAYFGTYSVDEDARVVTHHVTASVFPNWVGTDQRREIVLDGDRLTLDSPPLLFNGRMRVFRAVWKRSR